MPIRHKPLSRLTGCGRLIRIIHSRKTPLARQRLKQRASHHRGERFFPADGFSVGSARLSLVRHARRRCHPAGLSFSHRRQAAGRSKGVRGGLNPSRPHFVQRLLLAHRLIFQRDRLLDSPFSYPVLYQLAAVALSLRLLILPAIPHDAGEFEIAGFALRKGVAVRRLNLKQLIAHAHQILGVVG